MIEVELENLSIMIYLLFLRTKRQRTLDLQFHYYGIGTMQRISLTHGTLILI